MSFACRDDGPVRVTCGPLLACLSQSLCVLARERTFLDRLRGPLEVVGDATEVRSKGVGIGRIGSFGDLE